MKVTINGGHCLGRDSGATNSITGLQEAFVVKDIGMQICDFLRTVGYEALFLQENELQDICDRSNAFDADLFISIHCNSVDDPTANGMEIFTTFGETKADKLATAIMIELASTYPMSELQLRSDYVDGDVDKESNFYVLRNTDCPAVLIETAFISNPKEEALLADPSVRTIFAAAIARGVTDYVASIQAG